MGRKLKRVPLDFSWPLNKTWKGYINPFGRYMKDCPACKGSGYSRVAKMYCDQWYGNAPFDAAHYGATPLTIEHPNIIAFAKRNVESAPQFYGRGTLAVMSEAHRLWSMWHKQWNHNLIQADVDALVAKDRLWDFTRVPRTEEQRKAHEKYRAEGGSYWMTESNGYIPTADEVNAWSLLGMGHDAINQWICVEARCERTGVELRCAECRGSGHYWTDPLAKADYEAWEDYEPPTGEGYQLWETTSEGSPISPVFSTIEALCDYCALHCSTFGHQKTTATKWRLMLDDDFVCHEEEGSDGSKLVFI